MDISVQSLVKIAFVRALADVRVVSWPCLRGVVALSEGHRAVHLHVVSWVGGLLGDFRAHVSRNLLNERPDPQRQGLVHPILRTCLAKSAKSVPRSSVTGVA